jgi:DNA-binding response OmpR family regulator
MLKAIIIDDDPTVFSTLQRILFKKFSIEAFNASDGIQGLSLINKNKPDLIFLDVNMPLMDGVEVLEAIRYDPELKNAKIIMITSATDPDTINKIVSLGVSDYILKPLYSDKVYERVKIIISNYDAARRTNASVRNLNLSNSEKKSLLLADKDINFRSFFTQLYSSQFEIVEAVDGLECLQLFLQEIPQIVIVSEGLRVINEFLISKKIRDSEFASKTEIFLLSDSNSLDEKSKLLFDGVIKKSFVSDSFTLSFSNIVQHKDSINDKLIIIINEQIHSAIRQTIGVYLNEEIFFTKLSQKIKADKLLCCRINLAEKEANIRIIFELIGEKEALAQITKKLLGSEINENDVNDAFQNIGETVVGRLILSLEQEGIKLTQHPPEIITCDPEYLLKEKSISVAIKTETQNEFVISLDVKEYDSSQVEVPI